MHPKVSIIVPVYNIEKYIHRCIDSILAQTFIDFECILVDDCSPDNSGRICDEYAKQDKRIKVIHNKQNSGSSLSRKVGFKNSTGDYILFIDSDDYIEINMVEKIYSIAALKKLDMVYCNWYHYDELTNTIYTKAQILSNNFIENLKLTLITPWGTALWNKLIKREIYAKIIFPKYSCGEDVYITTQVLFFSDKIGHIDEALYHYCYNPLSVIHNPRFKWKRCLERRENYIKIFKFLKKRYEGDLSAFEPELSKKLDEIFYSIKEENMRSKIIAQRFSPWKHSSSHITHASRRFAKKYSILNSIRLLYRFCLFLPRPFFYLYFMLLILFALVLNFNKKLTRKRKISDEILNT